MQVGAVSSIGFMAENSRIEFENINQNSIDRSQLEKFLGDDVKLLISKELHNADHPTVDVFRIKATKFLEEFANDVQSKSIISIPINSTTQDIQSKLQNSLVKKVLPLLNDKCTQLLSAIKRIS